MKISELKDLDLSQYRIAYYRGDSTDHPSMCQDDVMALYEGGGDAGYNLRELTIALIPKKARLTECGGDDWNDSPADCNASGFYRYPQGTIFLQGPLGGELRLVDKFD